MNQQKLTHQDLEINTRRSTLQMLLLVLFTFLVAVPGLAQESNRGIEESDSHTASDSQAQVEKRFAAPVNVTFDNSITDPEAKRGRNAMFTRSVPVETAGGSSGSTSQPDPDSSKFAVFVEAGVAVPHGDLNTFLDPGFSFNAGLEYMITSQFSAEGIFGYQRFSNFFGGNTNLYQLAANGKFYFVDPSKKVRPFVNGGVGDYVTNSGTSHFGGNVGAGVLYEVTPKFGLQGSYNFHAFNTSSGAKFSTVQGGVRFRF